jgi:hypothetical protein
MVKIEADKRNVHIQIKGMTNEIISDMVESVKCFYEMLKNQHPEDAELFRRTIFLNEDLIFRADDKKEDCPRHKK